MKVGVRINMSYVICYTDNNYFDGGGDFVQRVDSIEELIDEIQRLDDDGYRIIGIYNR